MAEEQFIVSARKYRPSTWESVVGQSNITDTLQHAIDTGHLAAAYLFCGPRGVGKTTCARIFAKTINEQEGGDLEEDFSFNVFELDAASNNSVDDIRSITDQVRIPPQVGKYKVYIIDEVHMLSQAAFNAFLKTLEEPPPHAIFILATTEKHKIIPTILSRCQVYDFNRITIKDIASHLSWIADQENIKAEPDALHVIAEKADGALRDALSIFDQIVSYCDDNITYDAVIKNLNILDYEYYFRITEALLAKCATPESRATLAASADIQPKRLMSFVSRADFFRIKGVGRQFSELLQNVDVHTVQQLASANADDMNTAMVTVNEKKNLTKAVPSAKQIQGFIDTAKSLDGIVTL